MKQIVIVFPGLEYTADIPINVFESCNHSLEVADDVKSNINRLFEIMAITKAFISSKAF